MVNAINCTKSSTATSSAYIIDEENIYYETRNAVWLVYFKTQIYATYLIFYVVYMIVSPEYY